MQTLQHITLKSHLVISILRLLGTQCVGIQWTLFLEEPRKVSIQGEMTQAMWATMLYSLRGGRTFISGKTPRFLALRFS